MKRNTALLILSAAALTLTGCQSGEESISSVSTSATESTTVSSSAQTDETVETTSVRNAVVLGETTAATKESVTESGTSVFSNQTESAPVITQKNTDFKKSDLTFHYNGIAVSPDDTMNLLLKSLGEPDSFRSNPSCAYEGEDKTYTYGDMTIYTYPAGKTTDKVDEIEITGSSVSTDKGVKVGMTKEQITAIYGNGYVMNDNIMTYSVDDSAYFYAILENNKAASIGCTRK